MRCWKTLLLVSYGLCLLQWRTWAAGSGVCAIDFDGNLKTNHGERPAVCPGDVSLVAGKTGQAALFRAGAALSYPAKGNYHPRSGSVQFWVKPLWDSAGTKEHRVFWAVDADPGQDNRVAIGLFSKSWGQPGGFVYLHNGPYGPDRPEEIRVNEPTGDNIMVPVDWRAGQWHHLAAYWDDDVNYRALYIDGVKRGVTSFSFPMPTHAAVFHIGGRVGADGKAVAVADAAIDAFKLYAVVENEEYPRLAKARQSYLAAHRRLAERYSLGRVGRERLEVGWENLQGTAQPLS